MSHAPIAHSPAEMLADWRAIGVEITVEPDGQTLHVVAPRGALTSADRAAPRQLKPALLTLLATTPATPPPSASNPGLIDLLESAGLLHPDGRIENTPDGRRIWRHPNDNREIGHCHK